VNAATEAAASLLAETSSSTFRGLLTRLGVALLNAGKFLSSIKNLLAGLKFTAVVPGALEAVTMFFGNETLSGANKGSAEDWTTAQKSKLQA
jgi:hypothetical protein